jgi:hypothetical protein
MRRVDAHLEGLQPVAVPHALEGKAVRGRRGKAVERGEGRGRHVFGPEPAEQHAGFFQQRVAALLDALAQGAAGGLAGGVGAAAGGIELPAVERAAQAVALVAAEGQVGAAVRAVAVQQAVAAVGVLEQHKVLPQQAHRLHRAHAHGRVQRGVELIHQRHRLPVAAHQVAAGRAGANAGDQVVLFGFHGGLS